MRYEGCDRRLNGMCHIWAVAWDTCGMARRSDGMWGGILEGMVDI